MSGIAEMLINMGYEVSGSDISESKNIQHLRDKGARIYVGHKKENLKNPHVVVVSSAISKDCIEVKAALEKNIPVIPRAEMLAELMRLKYAICVAGTHGKTTTTSMIGLIIYQAGMDPTVVVGGRLKNLESNIKLGDGDFIVAEADESDGSFLHYTPSISVVTNIDNDHMDHYSSMKNLRETFIEFLNKVPFYGFSVLCGDDANIRKILPELKRPHVTYGEGKDNKYTAENIVLSAEKSEYDIYRKGKKEGRILIGCSGKYNVMNSMAACAVGFEMGIKFKHLREGLLQYKGVGRRLEKIAEKDGLIFYDDYAHHPTEIRMSIESLKKIYPDRRIVVIFQPHRFSRTKLLFSEFPGSLEIADYVFIAEIYGASEKSIKGVSSALISDSFCDKSKVRYIPDFKILTEEVRNFLCPGDVCMTLGAGDINKILKQLI